MESGYYYERHLRIFHQVVKGFLIACPEILIDDQKIYRMIF